MKTIVLLCAAFFVALPALAAKPGEMPPLGTKVDNDAVVSGTNSPNIYHYEDKNAEEWGVYTPPAKENPQQNPITIEPRVVWKPQTQSAQ